MLGASLLASVAVGCASEKSGEFKRVPLARAAKSDPGVPIFTLGVASGDPRPDRVMLWTRLVAEPMDEFGGVRAGSRLADTVNVAFDVATDEAFDDLVVSETAVASRDYGYSVHADATGLKPGTDYFYRFRLGEQISPVGRTRTLPEPGAEVGALRIVAASCQDFQWGYYGAWAKVTELKPDYVVFLGDYIYELTLGDLSPGGDEARTWAGPTPTDLTSYRWRYAQTKADPDLAAAHAACPWVITWDDHEVSNNYAGDVGQADGGQPDSHARRLAAYQAWWEHQPVRIEADSFERLDVYRQVDIGRLARIITLDTRQFADPPACRSAGGGLGEVGPLCEEADGGRTLLGADQEEWLDERLSGSAATWTVLASPVMVAAMNVGSAALPEYERDLWVGYPEARERLLATLHGLSDTSPIVLSGDWHASFVTNAGDAARPIPEFVGPAVSSVPFPEDPSATNAEVQYFSAANGFVVVEASAAEFRVEFWNMDDRWNQRPQFTQVAFTVASGERTAKPS